MDEEETVGISGTAVSSARADEDITGEEDTGIAVSGTNLLQLCWSACSSLFLPLQFAKLSQWIHFHQC